MDSSGRRRNPSGSPVNHGSQIRGIQGSNSPPRHVLDLRFCYAPVLSTQDGRVSRVGARSDTTRPLLSEPIQGPCQGITDELVSPKRPWRLTPKVCHVTDSLTHDAEVIAARRSVRAAAEPLSIVDREAGARQRGGPTSNPPDSEPARKAGEPEWQIQGICRRGFDVGYLRRELESGVI